MGTAHDHGHSHGHGHDHAHDHGQRHDDHDPHHHDDAPVFTKREARQARRLLMVLVLVAAFFVAEFAGAIAARSVVLEADALHLLMDVLALAMSLAAMRLAVRKPTPRFTFGMRRAEPVAAIFNATMVLAATVGIVHEGIQELRGAPAPRAMIMLVVSVAAIGVNGLSAWLLHGAIHHDHDHDGAHDPGHDHGPQRGHGHTLNLRGAWLHLLGDVLGSVAALVAALVIHFGGPTSVDPIASFLVAAILVAGAYRLLRDATLVLLEAAPGHLPVNAVRQVILAFPGVSAVHDLHVWTLGAGHDAITAHVRATSRDPEITRGLSKKLRETFVTEYVTVQVEVTDEECGAPTSP